MKRRRNSLRLKGFDYSQQGAYFVTILTHHRKPSLGRIIDGRISLSEVGRIVEQAWNHLPAQFTNIRAGRMQIMPDHLHGIIEILRDLPAASQPTGERTGEKRNCVGLINQTHTETHPGTDTPTGADWILMKWSGTQLGKIIRAFKAKSTRIIRQTTDQSFRWHRSFHDRIIRDDIARYFIERYIDLNPLMWELRHGDITRPSPDELRTRLRHEHSLGNIEAELLVERFYDLHDERR